MSVMLFFMEFIDMTSKVHNMWRYEKVVGYMKKSTFGELF